MKKKKIFYRLISLIMALLMTVSSLNVPVSAVENYVSEEIKELDDNILDSNITTKGSFEETSENIDNAGDVPEFEDIDEASVETETEEAELSSDDEVKFIIGESVFEINPMFEDAISDSLANELEEEFLEDDMLEVSDENLSLASAPTYDSVETVGDILREEMKNRNNTVNITYKAYERLDKNGIYNLWNDFMEEAFKETQNPTDGDYIRSHTYWWGYRCSYSTGVSTTTINYELSFSYTSTAFQELQVTNKVNEVLADLGIDSMTDIEKIEAIYDYIADSVEYNYDAVSRSDYIETDATPWSAYGAIVLRKCVCQGYAGLLYRMLEEAGIDSRYITGDGGGPHGWNIARYRGKYYNLDATWDADDDMVLNGGYAHNYFMKSNVDFPRHWRDNEYATEQFYSDYPMSDVSYNAATAGSDKGLDILLTKTDGTTISSKPEGKPKFICFGGGNCGITREFLSSFECQPEELKELVDFIYVEMWELYTPEDIQNTFGGIDGLTICYNGKSAAQQYLKHIYPELEYNGHPLFILLDENNNIVFSERLDMIWGGAPEIFDPIYDFLKIDPYKGLPNIYEARVNEDGSLILKWYPVDDAKEYKVYLKYEDNDEQIVTVTGCEYKGQVYKAGTYYARVQTVFKDGSKSFNIGYLALKLEEDAKIKCNVTFKLNNGAKDITTTVYNGTKITAPANVTKKGFSLVGWYTDETVQDETTKWNFDSDTVEGNITLYAKWEGAKYRVTLNPTGGYFNDDVSDTENKSFIVEYGKTYGEDNLVNIKRADDGEYKYVFTGWYTEETGGSEIKPSDTHTIEEDLTLYAVWDKIHKYVPAPVFSNYSSDIVMVEKGTKITLSCEDKNCEIYVADSTEKLTRDEGLYQDAIEITQGIKLYAVTYNPDTEMYSDIISCTYDVIDESEQWGEDITEEDKETLKEQLKEKLGEEFNPDTMNADDVPSGMWTTGIKDADYTGKAITYPGLRVYKGKNLLKLGTDYTVKYTNNTNAGTATVTITGKGYYTGKLVETFEIRQRDISTLAIPGNEYSAGLVIDTGSIDSAGIDTLFFEFNGKVQKGKAKSVKYIDKDLSITLKEGRDFTYVYPHTDAKDLSAENKYDENAFLEALPDGGCYEIRVVGKGNYTGVNTTLKERIVPKATLMSKTSVSKIVNQTYTGHAIIPFPVDGLDAKGNAFVKYGSTPLAIGTDYTVEYKNNNSVGTATVILKGTNTAPGYYTGTKEITFKIVEKGKISKAIFGSELTKTYNYDEYSIKDSEGNVTGQQDVRPVIAIGPVEGESKASVTFKNSNKEIIALNGIYKEDYDVLPEINADGSCSCGEEHELSCRKHYDYVYEYVSTAKNATSVDTEQLTKNIGSVKIVFTGINAYTGTASKIYKIVGTDISKSAVDFVSAYEYSMEAKEPEVKVYKKATKTEPEKVYTKDTDYTVEYMKNTDAGKATVVIAGINSCTGTIKKTFKINQYDISKGNRVTASIPASIVHSKGGAVFKAREPGEVSAGDKLVVKDGDTILKLGRDYTVKYANNTAVNDGIPAAKKKLPTVTITGKGNYKGTMLPLTYAITTKQFTLDSSDGVKIQAIDVAAQNKSNICKPTITITDVDGKVLAAGKDYDKNIEYVYYSDSVRVTRVKDRYTTETFYRRKGDKVDTLDIIPANTIIEAKVTGINNYEGTKSVRFRYVTTSISKATVTVKPQYYTGKAVCPTKDDITVTVNGVKLNKTDYEVVSYANNVSKGKATITISGLGNYGGYKSATFTIGAYDLSIKQ